MSNFSKAGIIDGPEYIFIEPGIYEASFLHYETNPRFSKKSDTAKIHIGGKIYLWFQIDPFGTAGLPIGINRHLFLAYNAKAIIKPFGENGMFKVGRRSTCYKDYCNFFNTPKNHFSLDAYSSSLWLVKVKTVTHDDKQKKHHKSHQYSVIERLIKRIE